MLWQHADDQHTKCRVTNVAVRTVRTTTSLGPTGKKNAWQEPPEDREIKSQRRPEVTTRATEPNVPSALIWWAAARTEHPALDMSEQLGAGRNLFSHDQTCNQPRTEAMASGGTEPSGPLALTPQAMARPWRTPAIALADWFRHSVSRHRQTDDLRHMRHAPRLAR